MFVPSLLGFIAVPICFQCGSALLSVVVSLPSVVGWLVHSGQLQILMCSTLTALRVREGGTVSVIGPSVCFVNQLLAVWSVSHLRRSSGSSQHWCVIILVGCSSGSFLHHNYTEMFITFCNGSSNLSNLCNWSQVQVSSYCTRPWTTYNLLRFII